jgi:O-antigen/teichoic acid export membrane protein
MLLQFGTLVVLAHALGPDDLGMAQFSFVVYGYGIVLNDLGLTTLGTREGGRLSTKLGPFGLVTGARLALSIPFLLAIWLTAAGQDQAGQVAIVIVSIAVLLAAFNLRWLLQADRDFGRLAALEVASAALQFVGALLVYSFGGGWILGLIVLISAPSIQAIGSVAVAIRRHSGKLSPAIGSATAPLIRSALPLGVALVVTSVYYSFDTLVIGLTRSPEEVGLYGAAYRIVLACLVFPVAVHGVALPLVARLVDAAQAQIKPLLLGLSVTALAVALPVAVLTSLYSDLIVGVVLGPGFAASGPLLRLLIWSLVTVSANVPFAVLLIAERRDRSYVMATAVGAAVSVTLDLALIPTYGPIAAAIVTLIAEVTVLSIIVWATRSESVPILVRALALATLPVMGVLLGTLVPSDRVLVGLAISLVGWFSAILLLYRLGVYRRPLSALVASANGRV